jgi:hypothetical protein
VTSLEEGICAGRGLSGHLIFTAPALPCDRDMEDQDLDCAITDDRNRPDRGMHEHLHRVGVQQCPHSVVACACSFCSDDTPAHHRIT